MGALYDKGGALHVHDVGRAQRADQRAYGTHPPPFRFIRSAQRADRVARGTRPTWFLLGEGAIELPYSITIFKIRRVLRAPPCCFTKREAGCCSS